MPEDAQQPYLIIPSHRYFVAGLLSLSAMAKVVDLGWFTSESMSGWTHFDIVTVVFLFGLSLWMVSGTFPIAMWYCAVATFAVFLVHSVASEVNGARHCNCFGITRLPRGLVPLLDSCILVYLLANFLTNTLFHNTTRRSLGCVLLHACRTASLFSVIALGCTVTWHVLHHICDVVGRVTHVATPERTRLTDLEFQLQQACFLQPLDSGKWIVIVTTSECPVCRNTLNEVKEYATLNLALFDPGRLRIALLLIDGECPTFYVPGDLEWPINVGSLANASSSRTLAPPFVAVVDDGRVVGVNDLAPAEYVASMISKELQSASTPFVWATQEGSRATIRKDSRGSMTAEAQSEET